jgi:DNA-binding CsgD family transcriptional regulator
MAAVDKFLQATRSIVTTPDLAAHLNSALRDLGFPNVSVTTITPLRLFQEPWRSLPDEFIKTYETRRWHIIDPILQFARYTSLPFRWSSLESSHFGLSPAQSRFLSDMQSFGLYSGLSIPFHGPKGACDVISISRAVPQPVTETEFDEIAAIALIAWRRHLEFGARPGRPGLPVVLTDREAECLELMQSGKTYAEMAALLGVTRKTIDFHARNVMHKLGANNRVTAVVIALRLGMIA